MKLEDQVVSLELAKRLKELGVKQESFFVWGMPDKEWFVRVSYPDGKPHGNEISAFSGTELGEMLPTGANTWKTLHQWICDGGIDKFDGCAAFTEADARAKALIHLLENKLVKP